MLVLENSPPLNVLVVNETGKDIILQNDAYIRNNVVDYFYCGDAITRDGRQLPRYYYTPLFTPQAITAQNTITYPVPIQFYAWQLSQIAESSDQKTSEAINQLAAETIKITDNWEPLKNYWKKQGNNLYLILTQ